MRKAVFLDRDGTLNEDPGYLATAEGLRLLPQVGEALGVLASAGYVLVAVTNQSGVARGLVPQPALAEIHARLNALLVPHGAAIERFQLCLHHPDEDCACRKPKPKLLLDAARELNLDLARSFMVGDRRTDLLAGRNAGCRGVALVRTGIGRTEEPTLAPTDADFVGDALMDVARWIVERG